MPDDTEPERLRAIADAHARCLAGKVAEGWLIDGMTVRPRGQRHDECRGRPDTPPEGLSFPDTTT